MAAVQRCREALAGAARTAPIRRWLHAYMLRRPEAQPREASPLLHLTHATAAFRLDRQVPAALLDADYPRRTGRYRCRRGRSHQQRQTLASAYKLARQEFRTTPVVSVALFEAGLRSRVMPSGTGFMVDIGARSGPLIALRTDMDALPIQDNKDVPYRSRIAPVCHACGHDVHTAILVGAAIKLAGSDLAEFGRVRCIFQPAEESPESGYRDMIAEGALDGVDYIFALHCDPSAEVDTVGTRTGPITSATDHIVTTAAWPHTPGLIETAVRNIVKPFAPDCDLDYVRVYPAVINDPAATEIINQAARSVANGQNVYQPAQNFVGEGFSWHLQDAPGAMFLLGIHAPGSTNQVDLHSGQFDVDERAIGVGIRMPTRTAINAARAWKARLKSCTDNN